MSELEDRLAALEKRLDRIEKAVQWGPPKSAPRVSPVARTKPGVQAVKPYREPAEALRSSRTHEPVSLAPQILGISGVAAFILAASYLVRLAIDSGWLTPERQIWFAGAAGVGMIVGGVWIRKTGRRYASLLSSAGVVVCFFTIYSAHLFFHLIGPTLATSLIAGLCLLALGLGHVFSSKAYVFIAVLGAYVTPFVVHTRSADVVQLVQYYSAWSVLFCAYSIWIGGRHAYLVASVLAIVGFDLIWRTSYDESWKIAVLYQASQFLLFTATTAFYSAKKRSPLTGVMAATHAPSLFFFYVIEYLILESHLPKWAPWISLASVLVVALAYWLARPRLEGAKAGATLVNWYAALVLFHAGYVELLPHRFHPWLALVIFIAIGAAKARLGSIPPTERPYLFAGSIICALNYVRVLAELELNTVPLLSLIYISYPVVLYVSYAATKQKTIGNSLLLLLFAAHVAAMVAIYRLIDTSVVVSILWGALAVGSLLIAAAKNNRRLAQSSFLVFFASAVKVMMFDLEGSSPLVKIGCLVALGASLYAGGWLYQRLDSEAKTKS